MSTAAPRHRAADRRTWHGQVPIDRAQTEIDRLPMLNFSGAMVSASSAVSTCGLASASSARLRRCSISARATGLVKGRSGSRIRGLGRPSLPPSSARRRHRHVGAGPGMLGEILAVWPTPLRVRACGSTSCTSRRFVERARRVGGLRRDRRQREFRAEAEGRTRRARAASALRRAGLCAGAAAGAHPQRRRADHRRISPIIRGPAPT